MIENTNEAEVLKPEKAPKKPNTKLRNALIRAGAALVVAAILAVVTKYSIVDLVRGPKETDDIQSEQIGAFVKRDIYSVMGFYADQTDGISGKYAVVPMGKKFVSVHFTKRYLDSADTIESDTNKYINGDLGKLDNYFVVEGTVGKLSEDLSGKMYTWYSKNKDTLVNKGVIANSSDAADYLSDYVLTVDTVNSMSEALVYTLTGIAAACLLYMLTELVLIAAGFYRVKPESEKSEASNEPEKKEEPIKADEPEDTDKSKNKDEPEKTEKPEDKE